MDTKPGAEFVNRFTSGNVVARVSAFAVLDTGITPVR
jgi:hypothetical protein